jgi:cytochrome c551
VKKKLLALIMGTALALSACGGGDSASEAPETPEAPADNGGEEAASPQDVAAEKIYRQSCASCHGQNLEGGIGPNLQQVGNKYSKDDILGIIQNGRGGMPGNLIQGEDADAVAAWLATKQ